MFRSLVAGFVGVLVGAAVVGMVAMRQQEKAVAKLVRAERFELVDAEGKMMAAWSSTIDGGQGLLFYNEAGKPVIALDKPAHGHPDLLLYDEAGKQRVWLGIDRDGDSGLSLCDKAGKERIELAFGRNEASYLILCDQAEKVRMGLAVRGEGPMLNLYGKAGEVLWEAP